LRYLANLKYFMTESINNLWYSRGVNSISIATIAISLYILGIFLLLMANVSVFFGELSGRFQIDIYLKDDVSGTERAKIEQLLEKESLVKDFSFMSREQALERFREGFPDLRDLPDELETNPMPSSFEVVIHESRSSDAEIASFMKKYSRLGGVEDIRYDKDWITRLRSYLNLMRGGGVILGGILYIAAAFTIANVIRLNVYSRRDEIEIMRLVGATNNFIRGPFLLEGIIQGLIGAFLSIIVLYATYRFFISFTAESYNIIFGFFTATFISVLHIALVIASGVAIGLTGSFISLRRFLSI